MYKVNEIRRKEWERMMHLDIEIYWFEKRVKRTCFYLNNGFFIFEIYTYTFCIISFKIKLIKVLSYVLKNGFHRKEWTMQKVFRKNSFVE